MTCREFIKSILDNIYNLDQDIEFFDKDGKLYVIDHFDKNCFDSINPSENPEEELDVLTITIKEIIG